MQTPSFPDDFSVTDHSEQTVVVVPIVDDQIDMRELAPTVDLGVTNTEEKAAAGERWVIQLGAFRNVDTVNELLKSLRAEGFSADSRILRRSDGQLHLLLVGPDLNEKALISQLGPLKELTGLEGKVVPYRPANE